MLSSSIWIENSFIIDFVQLVPNTVRYENWTVIDGDHIELADETKLFLRERGHQLEGKATGAIIQLVVQNLQNPVKVGRKNRRDSNKPQIFHGTLTAVSDPRKDGRPAAVWSVNFFGMGMEYPKERAIDRL